MAVHILNGADDKYLTGDRFQWVNLPRDAKWVDPDAGIENEDRLGRDVRVKVVFNEPGSHKFKLEVVPNSSNVDYTGAEKGRNDNFKYQETVLEDTTDADGTKIIDKDLFITCQGGDGFTFVATDEKGCCASSLEIEAKRIIWAVRLEMKGRSCGSLGPIKSVFRGHNIKVVELDPVEMNRIENIGKTSRDILNFVTTANTAYAASDGPSKEPYVVGIAFTDHLATKKTTTQPLEYKNVQVGPGGRRSVRIPVVGDDQNPRLLWRDIVTGEDWFISAEFIDATSGTVTPIAAQDVRANNSRDMHIGNTLTVKLRQLPAGQGDVRVNVHYVENMRGGIALDNSKLVAVCTRAYWQDVPHPKQHHVMIHEIGHKMGMVANGAGTMPDKTASHYGGSGPHKGNHCYRGLSGPPATKSIAEAQIGRARCVMYGITTTNMNFCPDCSPAVNKLDLSEGFG